MATKRKIIRQKAALKRRNSEALEWLEEATKEKSEWKILRAKKALEEVKLLKLKLN